MKDEYLIWSNEHRAWWKPGRWGYTTDIMQAGIYSKSDAIQICAAANPGGMMTARDGYPPEILIDKHSALEMKRATIAQYKERQNEN